jgi:hypothetical protein
LIKQLYPVEGLNIGKPNDGFWSHGDTVSMLMNGTSACVLKIQPIELPTEFPVLFGAPGKVQLADAVLDLSGVSGPVGESKDLMVLLDADERINKLTVNGKVIPFKQSGKVVDVKVVFAGKPFSQAQQIDEYDPDFNGRVVEGTFSIPKRIFDQLRRRKRQWPIPYTEDDRVAPWIDNSRLFLFVQIAEPCHDKEITVRRGGNDVKVMRNVPYGKEEIEIQLDGTPLDVREGYNGIYPYVTRTCMGMYADISHLVPDTPYRIKVTLPEGLRPGQFQGLFFEHVENVYTDNVVD